MQQETPLEKDITEILNKGLTKLVRRKIKRVYGHLKSGFPLSRLPRKFNPHALKGAMRGHWSVRITRNWRLVFQLDAEQNIIKVKYEDYH